MDDQSPVQHIECRTADEFLDSLSPRGKYFGGEDSWRSYIFRGHGDLSFHCLSANHQNYCVFSLARVSMLRHYFRVMVESQKL